MSRRKTEKKKMDGGHGGKKTAKRERRGGDDLSEAEKLIEDGKRKLSLMQDYILDGYSVQEKVQLAFLDPELQPSTKTLRNGTKIEQDILRVVMLPTSNATARINTLVNVFNITFGGTLELAKWATFFGPASVLPATLSVLQKSGSVFLKQVATKADTTEAQWSKHGAGGSYLIKAATELRGPLTDAEKAMFFKADYEIMKQLGIIGANVFAGTSFGTAAEKVADVADLSIKYAPYSYPTWKAWGAGVLAGYIDQFVASYVDTSLLDTAVGPYYAKVRDKIKANLPYLQTFAWWFGIPPLTVSNLDSASIRKFYNGVKSASIVLKVLLVWAWNATVSGAVNLNRPIGPAGLHKMLDATQIEQRDRIQSLLQEASGIDLKEHDARRFRWSKEIDELGKVVGKTSKSDGQLFEQTKELIPALFTAWSAFFQSSQLQGMFTQRHEDTLKMLQNYLGSDASNYSPLTLSRLAYSIVEDLKLVPVSAGGYFSNLTRNFFTIQQGLRYDRPKLLLTTGSGSSLKLAPGFLLALNRLAIFAEIIYSTNREELMNSVLGKIAWDTTASEYAQHAGNQSYLSHFRNRLYDYTLSKSGEDAKGSSSFVVAGASNTWEPLLRFEDEDGKNGQSTAKLLDFYPQPAISANKSVNEMLIQYGIIYDDVLRALVVTFRGTASPFDIFLDTDLRLRYYEFQRFDIPNAVKVSGYLHNSFYEVAIRLNLELYDWLNKREKVRSTVKCIVFTGHSLGAAVACVSTLMAHNALEEFNLRRIGKGENRLQQIFGVGFATPACMTPNLGKAICGLFHSVVFGFDIVPAFNPYSLYRYGLSKNILLPCSHQAGNCNGNDFISDPIADCQVFMPIIPGGSLIYGCWQYKGKTDDVASVNPYNIDQYIAPFLAQVHPAWMIDRLQMGPNSISDHGMHNYLHLLRTYYFASEDNTQHVALNLDSARNCLKTWKTSFMTCPAYPDMASDPALQKLVTAEDLKCLASIYNMDFSVDRTTATPLAPQVPSSKGVKFFEPPIACNNGPKNAETVCESFFSDEEQLEKLFENGSMIQALASSYSRKAIGELMILGQPNTDDDENVQRSVEKMKQIDELKRRAFLAQGIIDAFRQAYGPSVPSAGTDAS